MKKRLYKTYRKYRYGLRLFLTVYMCMALSLIVSLLILTNGGAS